MLRFGSLNFVATSNSYDMELLPAGANPDTPTPPPQHRRHSGQCARQTLMERRRAARLATPTWVEFGTSRPAAAAGDVTTSSPPSNAASVLPKEGATAPSAFPFGIRNAAMIYASSTSTNMSAYEDLLGHHLISIRNLIASSPDDSYPDTADDINFFRDNFTASKWDYSGVRSLDAF